MSSDDPGAARLLPNYEISLKELFHQLVDFLLGRQVSVKTWHGAEMAVIKSKGCIIGKVLKTEIYRDDRQQVVIMTKDGSGCMGPRRTWTLQTSAKSIQVGDLVCFLQGAPNPTIIRPCMDYFSIIMITATPPETESRSFGQPIASFPHDFLLAWDWEKLQGKLEDQEYEPFMNSRVNEHSDHELGGHLEKMTRLWNVALIFEDAEEYEKSREKFQENVEGYERGFGKEDPRTLPGMEKITLIYTRMERWKAAAEVLKQVVQTRTRVQGIGHPDTIRSMENLVPIYNKMERWEAAVEVLRQVVQTTNRVQGIRHPDTTRSMVNIASAYRDHGNLKEAKVWGIMIVDILERTGDNVHLIEKEVVRIATSADEDLMKSLLDLDFPITEGVVTAAARNVWSRGIMKLLLDQKGNEVQITEGVAIAAAANDQTRLMMKLLLDRKGNEVKITEDVIRAAAQNSEYAEEVMSLLIDQKGNEVQITEGVVIAAVGNTSRAEEVMNLLLDQRGNEIQITESVVIAAVGNPMRAERLMGLLLDRRGNEVQITENVVIAAVKNYYNGDLVIKLLLNRRGNKIPITENVIAAGRGKWAETLQILLDWKQADLTPPKSGFSLSKIWWTREEIPK